MSAILNSLSQPIIAAPMAGGPSTPALAAAVSGAGGLGFLAAGYVGLDRLAADVAATRAATGAAFGVNVFAPVDPEVDQAAVRRYAAGLRGYARRLGVSLGEPVGGDDGYLDKLRLLAAEAVPVVSVTFGLPEPEQVAALHARGSEVWVTVTHPDTAVAAAARGADAIVVQGVEAGGHRGGVGDTDCYALLPLLRLVAARVDTPLVAAGGIGDGAGVAAALAAGARAVQLGTAFLCCPEAGTSPEHRAALLAGHADTWLTRAFSGRRARGIVNDFMRQQHEAAPAGYPHVNQVTQPLRAAARRAGQAELINMWAGQAYPLCRAEPAANLVGTLVTEAAAAARRLPDLLPGR